MQIEAINDLQGQCLCGGVDVNVKQASIHLGACHCHMCRTWGGGPLLALDCGTVVEFTDTQHVKVFNSSEWAERGFCSNCGTHLFYRLKESGQYIMPAGLFDFHQVDLQQMVFDHQVFIDQKPAYYEFANQTKNMTGAELFAMYAPADENQD